MHNGDRWDSGDPYERFMGRWSRLVAQAFVQWLDLKRGLHWIDIGCGTGALSDAVLSLGQPAAVLGIDQSPAFVSQSRQFITDRRARFEVADALNLHPAEAGTFEAAVSGLMLNFVPNPLAALAEMKRVVGPGGTIAIYLWDYAGEMQFLRRFWDAAVALNPEADMVDEGRRFPLCRPEPLKELFENASLKKIIVQEIDVATTFNDFDDYWTPFLGEVGPAPAYVASLASSDRDALRDCLLNTLDIAQDGKIHLIARAWAVRATS